MGSIGLSDMLGAAALIANTYCGNVTAARLRTWEQHGMEFARQVVWEADRTHWNSSRGHPSSFWRRRS